MSNMSDKTAGKQGQAAALHRYRVDYIRVDNARKTQENDSADVDAIDRRDAQRIVHREHPGVLVRRVTLLGGGA